MGENQKISCTVGSCKFNNFDEKKCILNRIMVTPIEECNTKKAEESMCSSYEFQNKLFN